MQSPSPNAATLMATGNDNDVEISMDDREEMQSDMNNYNCNTNVVFRYKVVCTFDSRLQSDFERGNRSTLSHSSRRQHRFGLHHAEEIISRSHTTGRTLQT